MKSPSYHYIAVVVLILLLFGCGHTDSKMLKHELTLNPSYGQVTPRIPFEQFKYYTGQPEPFKPYTKMAEVIVQMKPQYSDEYTKTPDDMIQYMCKTAWEKGADAVVNVSFGVEGVKRESSGGTKFTVFSEDDRTGVSWFIPQDEDEVPAITFTIVKGIAVRFDE